MDIESYGALRRTTPHRLTVRRGLDQALRRAFDEAGVPWFDCRHESTGDGTFVLVPAQVPKSPFVEVLSMVLARELRRHNEAHQPEEQIRLRMALHAGEVAYDDQGVTGSAINRTFRLLEAPQLKAALAESPGVLALITSDWFFDEVVRSSTVVDAATFRPVRVAVKETIATGWISLPDHFCAPHPELGIPTPPRQPATVDAHGPVIGQCTLPRDLPVFTGRAKELDILAATVTAEAEKGTLGMAIHVIDGMPGTGKTTFAVHAAYQLAAHFPDGQIFLELHGHSPSQVPVTPADALASLLFLRGVSTLGIPADLDDRARLWREKLTGKKILLLLDDAVDGEQIQPLLPGGAGCLVLITSRHRFESIADAGRVSLQTLPAAEAAAMFDRFTSPEQHEPGAVAELMTLCGNLPLAISLTAGRLRSHPSWTLRQLADDLNHSQNRLKTLRADNRSVAAAFELSYRDLDPDQQRLFRRLSLHPGSHIDAAAAAALDGNDVDATRERLEVLYLNNLLDEPSPGRYRLHDLTQAYSQSLTDPKTDKGAFERLLDYYLETVRAASQFAASPSPRLDLGPRLPMPTRKFDTEGEAIAWLTAERPTIGACINAAAASNRVRRAAELAAALYPFLEQHGYWHDAYRLQRAVLTAAQEAGDLVVEAATRADLGRVLRLLGNYHDAAATLACARDLYLELGNRLGEADVLNEAGRVQQEVSNFIGATAYLDRAHQLYEELHNPLGVAATFAQLARVQYRSCDLEAARTNAERSLDLYRLLGNEPGEMSALLTVGCAQGMSGAYACAVAAFTQALSLSRKLGDRFAEARALNNLGRMHFDCGNYGTADSYYSRAQIIYSQLDYRARVAVTLTNLGRLHHAAGNHRLAFTYMTRAADLFGDDQGWHSENLNNLGSLALEWPDAGDPAELHGRALDLARAVGVRLQVGRALEGLGRSALKAADGARGIEYLRQALALYRELAVPEAAAVRATLDELANM
ncbi:ATP-binding protein [Amycolatopsis mediterranei]|uniref:ATPase n=1 Tax=Amycolatopsis mediterranei (strain S699) TaxID=713604 RepID=A0A9R0NSF6_AMYMS|nr:tetratricopeptide repeat protein [Amycolatopsis mediterranei]AEK39792.1 ATPase [Amycolatopsis mediterranei S699]KDO05005.1 ATPase [Amycolatopsis mediterranei]KDU90135.1 ATPase [Amycolatopsis mediterranei]UZF68333.1 tetratricopeptide repeat protein [Amycolatopsis mediterranei]